MAGNLVYVIHRHAPALQHHALAYSPHHRFQFSSPIAPSPPPNYADPLCTSFEMAHAVSTPLHCMPPSLHYSFDVTCSVLVLPLLRAQMTIRQTLTL